MPDYHHPLVAVKDLQLPNVTAETNPHCYYWSSHTAPKLRNMWALRGSVSPHTADCFVSRSILKLDNIIMEKLSSPEVPLLLTLTFGAAPLRSVWAPQDSVSILGTLLRGQFFHADFRIVKIALVCTVVGRNPQIKMPGLFFLPLILDNISHSTDPPARRVT